MVIVEEEGEFMGLMLPKRRQAFKNWHAGKTIWVVGSGSSVDHIGPRFFDDKIVVCVNRVGSTLGIKDFYTVTHYHRDAMIVAAIRPDLPVITPENDLGAGTWEEADHRPTEPSIYFFPTGPQLFGAFDAHRDWPTDPDALVAGPTSLHMTMHFAQYLGAAHIILVGADCGKFDDASNFDGYSIGDNPFPVWERTLGQVAGEIRAHGTSVHSLNPFASLALEGHSFASPSVRINC